MKPPAPDHAQRLSPCHRAFRGRCQDQGDEKRSDDLQAIKTRDHNASHHRNSIEIDVYRTVQQNPLTQMDNSSGGYLWIAKVTFT